MAEGPALRCRWKVVGSWGGVGGFCVVRRAGVAAADVVVRWRVVTCWAAVFTLAASLCRLGTRWLRRDFLPLRGLLALREG